MFVLRFFVVDLLLDLGGGGFLNATWITPTAAIAPIMMWVRFTIIVGGGTAIINCLPPFKTPPCYYSQAEFVCSSMMTITTTTTTTIGFIVVQFLKKENEIFTTTENGKKKGKMLYILYEVL